MEYYQHPGCLPLPSPRHHAPQEKHYLDFSHHTFVLHVFELSVNGVIQYVLFCVSLLLLTIMLLRFIHLPVCWFIFH